MIEQITQNNKMAASALTACLKNSSYPGNVFPFQCPLVNKFMGGGGMQAFLFCSGG